MLFLRCLFAAFLVAFCVLCAALPCSCVLRVFALYTFTMHNAHHFEFKCRKANDDSIICST